MEKLTDSAAGSFTATYDVEGKLISEGYPNGMCANTTYNEVGEATLLEYLKTTNCSEKTASVWFKDSIVPSIHEETLQQTSTLAKENYVYNNAGQLTEAQETPTGKGCRSRLYSYDEEGNRTSEITRESSTEACSAENSTDQGHIYDSANRLIDNGVEYETFGNAVRLPAVDSGEHELASTYYVDNQVYTQKQNGETLTYTYDPAGRTMETLSEGKAAARVVTHYAGIGEAPTWTSEGSEKWSRNIPGIDGTLCAVQKAGERPVLELHDLQGNIVGTAALSEGETKLLSTYNSTEFGVPQPGTAPPPYAWLGAADIATEPAFASGVATQGGSSYVPEIGRQVQAGTIASPGSFPDGTGGAGMVNGPVPAGLISQLRAIGIQNEAVREESRKLEAYEKECFCEKYPDGSACHVDGPGEGNCEEGQCDTEGPGEETFGDPVHCYVGGSIASEGDKGFLYGYGGCSQGLPQGTWIKVCIGAVQDEVPGYTARRCEQVEVKYHTSRYWSISLSAGVPCAEGELLWGYVAFYVPGAGKTLYAGTVEGRIQGECDGGLGDEASETAVGLWPIPDLPPPLDLL